MLKFVFCCCNEESCQRWTGIVHLDGQSTLVCPMCRELDKSESADHHAAEPVTVESRPYADETFGGGWSNAQPSLMRKDLRLLPTPAFMVPQAAGQPRAQGTTQNMLTGLSPSQGTTSATVGPALPQEFQPNLQFLDARNMSGWPLARWVKSTNWSYKKQIVGCSIHAIPLQAVLYKGFQSYWLRRIAEGRPTFLAGFRSLPAVVFCHAVSFTDQR